MLHYQYFCLHGPGPMQQELSLQLFVITQSDGHGYPLYRHRSPGDVIAVQVTEDSLSPFSKGQYSVNRQHEDCATLANQSQIFQCHLNVEFSVKAINKVCVQEHN